jgi:hypothetical protein
MVIHMLLAVEKRGNGQSGQCRGAVGESARVRKFSYEIEKSWISTSSRADLD